MQPKRLPGYQYADQVYDPRQIFAALQQQQYQMQQQRQQPQQMPQQEGFLTGLARAIAHPFAEFGTAIAYTPKAVSRLIQNKPIDDIQKRVFGTTDSGSIAKKIIGDTAQIGLTVAAPSTKGMAFGKAVKTGAAAGAGFGGASAMSNDASLEDTLKQIAIGAGFGGATAGVGNKLFGNGASKAGPGVIERTGNKLEETGGKLMNSQSNLTRAQVRQIGANGPELFNTATNKYGLSNLKSIAKVSQDVTGKNGVYSEGVRNAIFSGPGIKVDSTELQDTLSKLLDTHAPLVNNSTRKNLSTQLHNSLQTMFADQPLNPLGSPSAAYDVANAYKTQAAQLLKGANVSSADKQLSKVYSGLAKTLDDKLYSQPGVVESIPQIKQGMTAAFNDLAMKSSGAEKKAFTKLAQEAQGINDIAGLRSAQQKWVQLSQLADKTAQAEGGAAMRLAGGGGVRSRVGNAVLDTISPVVGRATSKLGNTLSNFSSPMAGKSGNLVDAISSRGGMLGMYQPPQMVDVPQQDMMGPEDQMQSDFMGQSLMGQFGQMDQMGGTQQESPYPMEAMLSDIQRDPKNASTYQSIFKMVQDQYAPKKSVSEIAYERKIRDAQAGVGQALGNIEELQQAYNKAGGAGGRIGGTVSGLVGKVGLNDQANVYNSSKQAFLSQIARTLGEKGMLSDKDITRIEKALPSLSSTKGEADAKWRLIKSIISNGVNSAQSAYGDARGDATPDLQTALMQAQGGGYY